MKYVVAVSGGIDSVVLLDMLAAENKHDIMVAHFDHGIRPDSADDARFVEGISRQYGFPFVSRREELGAAASEETARNRRYVFLKDIARAHNACIVTAHHGDDVVETIAINLLRGTGWRGAAVLDSAHIIRPLLAYTKKELREYALERRLEWVEDSTNKSDNYLRNRLRRQIAKSMPHAKKQQLQDVWRHQRELKGLIDEEVDRLLEEEGKYSRYFFSHIDALSANELLRGLIVSRVAVSPTRPQIQRALLAVKTARPGTQHDVGGDVTLHFTARSFIVRTP